jgi:hypothetical protein
MQSPDFDVFQIFLKSVVFLVPVSNEVPIGTGFLVSIFDGQVENLHWSFLVTNKHVVQEIDRDPNGNFNGSQFFDEIRIRFNQRDRKPFGYQNLAVKNVVVVHDDQRVDLAVIPVPQLPLCDLNSLDVGVIYGNQVEGAPSLSVGRDTVTASLLEGYSGIERNHPVCRFGKIALTSDEYWCDTKRGAGNEQAWLIDLGTYEGASGSPVFLSPVQFDLLPGGQTFCRSGGAALVGVVKATFESVADPLRKLRALTPVEPIPNLQAIFDKIIRQLEMEGHRPTSIKSSSLYLPH